MRLCPNPPNSDCNYTASVVPIREPSGAAANLAHAAAVPQTLDMLLANSSLQRAKGCCCLPRQLPDLAWLEAARQHIRLPC